MKIYIAGPITGHLDYRSKFKKAENELIKKGHTVLNPAYLPDGLKDYMSICKAMIDQADALYMLEGYESSVGAKEELAYADECDKKVLYDEKCIEVVN